MRCLAWVVLVAACGDNGATGALLVLDAPEGATASRIEILLASASPTTIQDVENQRVEPTDLAQEPVRYYRQRATTGELTDVGALDGFTVRLEPNVAMVPEGALIPILVAFDAQDQIVAIGSVLDNGLPAPTEIIDGQLARFEVSMMVVAQTDGLDGIAANELVAVDCQNFRSGLAWKPGDTQVRLLLPDRSQDPEATDASMRIADLDCDGHKAIADDCDDLRSEFHGGAEESCDGLDHDCDFRAQELVPCTGITTACGETTGVGICFDRPDATNTTVSCVAEPECACEEGICAVCKLPFEGADGAPAQPCSPAIARDVFLEQCAGACSVEVLTRPGEQFRVRIALPGTDQFTDKLTQVTDRIDIQVEAEDSLAAVGGDLVGGIFLSVSHFDGQAAQVSFAIKLEDGGTTCDAGPATMACSQP